LSLSLGVDETFIGQVFDTYKPRSADLLEAFTIHELAHELGQDPATLMSSIRERQREQGEAAGAGCKPQEGRDKRPGSDDEGDKASSDAARRHAGGGHSARAAGGAACGHEAPFTESQHGSTGSKRGQGEADGELKHAGGGQNIRGQHRRRQPTHRQQRA
jgi:hypothetical protein